MKVPRKLRKDTIAEAICEIRFLSIESQQLPEMALGKLGGLPLWQDYKKVRLPVADVPLALRLRDPNLVYQPVMEFRSEKADKLAKLGHNVLSYHLLEPYPGWKEFQTQLHEVIGQLFAVVPDIQVKRLGMRYINLFRLEDHGVPSVGDLNISVSVAGSPLTSPFNLNYLKSCKTKSFDHRIAVRIASAEFVSGPKAQNTTVAVDVDIFTPDEFSIQDSKSVKAWIEDAHEIEKTEFFTLFTEAMLERLVED
jgi:uncharacterized protein (TIGR04255 family)